MKPPPPSGKETNTTPSSQSEMTIQQTLELAAEHHIQGRLPQAEHLYVKVLQKDPNQVDAIHMLGLIAHQVGKNKIAVELISKAIEVRPGWAEAHSNLGFSLRHLGRLEEALANFEKAILLDPNFADGHHNHGVSLHDLGRFSEAIISFERAIQLKRDSADLYVDLGYTLRELGKFTEAVPVYQRALTIDPTHLVANRNLGLTYRDLGQLDSALKLFKSTDNQEFQSHILECLFALGEYDRFYETLNRSLAIYETNIRAAAISAFASQQLGRPDPHPFCRNSLDFVRVYRPLEAMNKQEEFLTDLVKQAGDIDAIWEPLGKTTKKGFQTYASLFDQPSGPLARLEQIIKDQIEKYAKEFAGEDCGFLTSFPKKLNLTAWFVRLTKGGHQTEHIHPSGWLSGVFYVQIPKTEGPEEGAIELGLWGYNYPIVNNNYPKQRHYPTAGSLILFPSSLFHRTIPFHGDQERLCIAFDLLPTQNL